MDLVKGASCNCGVVAREGGDVIYIGFCDQINGGSFTVTPISSGQLDEGTVVKKKSATKYIVGIIGSIFHITPPFVFFISVSKNSNIERVVPIFFKNLDFYRQALAIDLDTNLP